MTENAEQEERIRRLQERRGNAPSRAASTATRTPEPGGRRRRKHHYNASRIVLAGLSVTSFFTIIGALGAANQSQPVATAPTTAATPQAPAAPASSPAVSGSATPAKAAPTPHAKPVTRSHGS